MNFPHFHRKYIKYCIMILIVIVGLGIMFSQLYNQQKGFIKGIVVSQKVLQKPQNENQTQYVGTDQELLVKLTEGNEKDRVVQVQTNTLLRFGNSQLISENSEVVVLKVEGNSNEFVFVDRFRLNRMIFLVGLFFVLVLVIARSKGLASMLGLGGSIAIIFYIIFPAIARGYDTLLVSVGSVLFAAIITFYLAHGIKVKTTLALISSIFTLIFVCLIGYLSTQFLGISGGSNEDALYLQNIPGFQNLNINGLFLGGILLATLGVLDDITITQVAIVQELKKADHNLGINELFKRARSIGNDHIASLINTLAFAFLGSSFPLLLSFALGKQDPLWILFNTETISGQILSIIIGSFGIVISVPISTYLAAHVFGRFSKQKMKTIHNHHGHHHH
jgi:uncharacterized membrane protein